MITNQINCYVCYGCHSFLIPLFLSFQSRTSDSTIIVLQVEILNLDHKVEDAMGTVGSAEHSGSFSGKAIENSLNCDDGDKGWSVNRLPVFSQQN